MADPFNMTWPEKPEPCDCDGEPESITIEPLGRLLKASGPIDRGEAVAWNPDGTVSRMGASPLRRRNDDLADARRYVEAQAAAMQRGAIPKIVLRDPPPITFIPPSEFVPQCSDCHAVLLGTAFKVFSKTHGARFRGEILCVGCAKDRRDMIDMPPVTLTRPAKRTSRWDLPPEPEPRRENRCKLVNVNPRLLVDFLNASRTGKTVGLPISPEIPDGVVVEEIHHDFSRRALVARLYHPSWPVVPDGEELPHVDGFLRLQEALVLMVAPDAGLVGIKASLNRD